VAGRLGCDVLNCLQAIWIRQHPICLDGAPQSATVARVKPVAAKAGIEIKGWHTLRHRVVKDFQCCLVVGVPAFAKCAKSGAPKVVVCVRVHSSGSLGCPTLASFARVGTTDA